MPSLATTLSSDVFFPRGAPKEDNDTDSEAVVWDDVCPERGCEADDECSIKDGYPANRSSRGARSEAPVSRRTRKRRKHCGVNGKIE